MARIACIVYGDINVTTGGNYYDRMLIKALENHGHTVIVRNPADVKASTPRSGMGQDVDMYIIDELCHPDFTSPKHVAAFGGKARRVAMVHHLAAQEKLKPYRRLKHLIQERRFLSRMEYCICNSASTKRGVRSLGGYRGPSGIALPGRAAASPADINAQKLEKKLTPDQPVKLLSLGNMIPRKGFHHVIKSLRIEPRLPCLLEIAGNPASDPVYTEELHTLVQSLKLDRQVCFLGYVDEDEKKRLLEKADFLVVPSDHEGYGIVYLEAMEYGTVPIGSVSGGAAEVIESGYNGFLIPPKSPKSIYNIISDLISFPDKYTMTSRRSIETWQLQPTWASTFDAVIADIEKLL